MKKRSCSSQKSQKSEGGPLKKEKKERIMTFDISKDKLKCFISSSSHHLTKVPLKRQTIKATSSQLSSQLAQDKKNLLSHLRVPRRNVDNLASKNKNSFNNTLLLLDYEGEEEQKADIKIQNNEPPKEISEDEDEAVSQVVNSCLRVITQDTEHSSNPVSARYTPQQTPMNLNFQFQMPLMDYYYLPRNPPAVRNRRAINTQESKAYVIDVKKVELDGRTTIMIRNIPNKYTQEMLLQLFEQNNKKNSTFSTYQSTTIITAMQDMHSSTLSIPSLLLTFTNNFTTINGTNLTPSRSVKSVTQGFKVQHNQNIISNIQMYSNREKDDFVLYLKTQRLSYKSKGRKLLKKRYEMIEFLLYLLQT